MNFGATSSISRLPHDQPMAIELKKVVIGLNEDAYAALRIRAEVKGQDIGEAGRELLVEKLFGEMHGIKLAAARFARATKQGNSG